MSVKNIIKEAKRQLGNISQPKFAEITGFNINRVKNLESGRVDKFTDEEIEILVKLTTLDDQEIRISQIMGNKYNKYDDSYWVTTGDNEAPYVGETNIIRGTYDRVLDTWTWAKLHGDLDAGCTYKLISVDFLDDSNVICGDDNTVTTVRNGLWTCPIAGLNNTANFVSVFKTILGGGMGTFIDGLNFIGALVDSLNTNVLISSKSGVAGLRGTKVYGLPTNIVSLIPVNKRSDGWFMIIIGMSGVAEGDGLSTPNIMWLKIK